MPLPNMATISISKISRLKSSVFIENKKASRKYLKAFAILDTKITF